MAPDEPRPDEARDETPRPRPLVFRLADQVQVVRLNAEVQDPHAEAVRRRQERAAYDSVSVTGTQAGQAGLGANRHVDRMVEDCNWLQALEGGVDSAHSSFLHRSAMGGSYLDGSYSGVTAQILASRTDGPDRRIPGIR